MPQLAREGGRKASWGAIRVRGNEVDGPGVDTIVTAFTDASVENLTDLIQECKHDPDLLKRGTAPEWLRRGPRRMVRFLPTLSGEMRLGTVSLRDVAPQCMATLGITYLPQAQRPLLGICLVAARTPKAAPNQDQNRADRDRRVTNHHGESQLADGDPPGRATPRVEEVAEHGDDEDTRTKRPGRRPSNPR